MPVGPLIAVAGSADPARTDYQPPLVRPQEAPNACEQIGAALARGGCRLIVYSSSPAFLEANVVRGFVAASRPDDAKTIQVRFPQGAAAATFEESKARPQLFDYRADALVDWEASFYRSLRDADGVVLIGGAKSVLITGHIALGYRIPIVAIPAFGGASQTLWQALVPQRDLVTEDDKNAMAQPLWSAETAEACVAGLLAQLGRRRAEIQAERHRHQEAHAQMRTRAIVAAVLFLATLTVLAVGLTLVDRTGKLFPLLVYFASPLAGASGATIRMVWSPEDNDSFLRKGTLGLVAGGISGVLFLLAQVASSSGDVAPRQPSALAFVVMIGFAAGFTFDRVFKKIAEVDVTDVSAITQRNQ